MWARSIAVPNAPAAVRWPPGPLRAGPPRSMVWPRVTLSEPANTTVDRPRTRPAASVAWSTRSLPGRARAPSTGPSRRDRRASGSWSGTPTTPMLDVCRTRPLSPTTMARTLTATSVATTWAKDLRSRPTLIGSRRSPATRLTSTGGVFASCREAGEAGSCSRAPRRRSGEPGHFGAGRIARLRIATIQPRVTSRASRAWRIASRA